MKRGIPKLEKIRRQIILPPWARQIKVRQTDTYLVVFGKRWWFHPLKRDPYGDWDMDILRGFDEDRTLPPTRPSKAPHSLFARAHTLAKQVEFVQKFGPVLASKIRYMSHDTVIARQNLKILSFEQQLFSRIFNLTKLINELTSFSRLAYLKEETGSEKRWILLHEDYDFASIAKGVAKRAKEFDSFLARDRILALEARRDLDRVRALVSEIDELMNPSPEDHLLEFADPSSWRSLSSPFYAKEQISKASSLDVLDAANELLCSVFNLFPVTLHYAAGMAHYMPEMNPSGIRPALYYLLRLNYLSHREIKLCAHPSCGRYFVPDRTDRIYCSDSCYGSAKTRRHTKKVKLVAQDKSR